MKKIIVAVVLSLFVSVSVRGSETTEEEESSGLQTNFVLGASIGDGSFGFEEPWTEFFFGVEYSTLKRNELKRECSFRLGISPTDKDYGGAKTHSLSVRFLQEIRKNIFVGVGFRASRLETELYEKDVARGDLVALRQFAMSRLGGRIILPIKDPENLRSAGLFLESPLALTQKGWMEYRMVVTTEVLYAMFESGGRERDDTTFRVTLTLRL